MRISTSNFFETATTRLTDLQSSLAKTQQQLTTGKRMLSASDDPIAAARVVELAQAQSQNAQLGINRRNAAEAMTHQEAVLYGVTSLMHDAKELIVSAGSGVLSDADRSFIATSMAGRLDELFGLANTADASGNYIFGGFKTAAAPFSRTATGAQYNGDQGERTLQVDTSRRVAVNDSGDKVFQFGGQDVFKTLTDLVAILNVPVTDATTKDALTASLATANTGLTASLDRVLTIRAANGSRMPEIGALDVSGSAKDINLQASISQLEDVDYVKAITMLTQQKTMLDAAQQSFVKISNMSLFNYL